MYNIHDRGFRRITDSIVLFLLFRAEDAGRTYSNMSDGEISRFLWYIHTAV